MKKASEVFGLLPKLDWDADIGTLTDEQKKFLIHMINKWDELNDNISELVDYNHDRQLEIEEYELIVENMQESINWYRRNNEQG